MNKKLIYITLAGCLILAACGKKEPPANNQVPVNLYTVKLKKVLYYDNYPATTVALSQVNLLAQVQGYITGIFFKEGSHVEKGQKLYEIDRRIYQANYDGAVANLKVAEGNLTQAQQDADRYAYLNSYNAVAKQLYDHAVIALQNAKNQVKSAQEAVNSAKTNLNYAVITAPFSGTIGLSQVKLGNFVTVGSTILNTISTDNPMAVDFVINEKQLTRFEKLDRSKETPADSLFTMLLPDNSLYPQIGKISVIDRAVDPQTGTITIRLVFANPDYLLRPGMSCVIRVHNQDRAPQLVIPNKAVIEQMGEYFVFTARDSTVTNPDSKDNGKHLLVAEQIKVEPGQTVGSNVVIKSGISDGERIVTDGVQSLHDGTQITTANRVPPSQGRKK
ncbi:MAG TPA: efflux RND transporter periplasmic adaptor subunit [Mucilaginibacter sp.]|nr:efflux RND transporter periplasmic adaptor subunit [Mucilaginibacter sp.]